MMSMSLPLWLLCTVPASAADVAADALFDGLSAELVRAEKELRLPEVPGPYHIATLAYDVTDISLSASLGGLVNRTVNPRRTAGFIVRSGSPSLDNTNFDASRTGIGSVALVQGDDPMAIRKDVWWRLDQLYKQSVEALAAKEAAMARRAEPDDVPDFAPEAPATARGETVTPFDADALEALARELSAVFLARPEIEWSTVFVTATAGRRIMLDTGGTKVIEPVSVLVLRVIARVRADDGTTAVDHVTHVVRGPASLPPKETLLAQSTALADRLARWRSLPVLEEEYVGPVLFEGDAAVDVVQRVLAPALLGTPPEMEPPRGSRVLSFGDSGESTALQLKRRLLPSGFSVVDDPSRDLSRASSYRFDSEGVAAQRVELVIDGIVRTHLMSRIPSEAVPKSNGHGRAQPGNLVRALPSDLVVTGAKERSDKALHKTALKLATEYTSPRYAVIRRLADPTLASFDGGPLFSFGDDGPSFPPPLEVALVAKDGTEQSYRGIEIAGLDQRALKEVVSSGESTTRTLLWSSDRFSSPVSGISVTVTAPHLLFGEIVLGPSHEDAEKPPMIGNPLAQ